MSLSQPLLPSSLRALALSVALLVPIWLVGCTPQVGDACLTAQDCNTGALCDTSAPGGYCTVTPCEVGGCPEESVCVEFEGEQSYCMLKCSGQGDCRSNYTCRDDIGSRKFCYIE